LGDFDLLIDPTSDISSANASSFVLINGTGKLQHIISSGKAYIFPVGENGSSSNVYLPLSVQCNSCTNEAIKIGVEHEIYEDPSDHTSQTFTAASHTNFVNKTWNLTTDGISGNVTVLLQWNASDQSSNPGATNSANDLIFASWEDVVSTSSWDGTTVATSGNPSANIYTQERVFSSLNNALYYFGIGSNSTPLPVVFSAFDVACFGEQLLLEWTTETEINCSHFVIEGSENGLEFYELTKVEGYGNSISTKHYSQWISALNMRYFRLNQFDFDGKNQISKTVVAECLSNENTGFIIDDKTLFLNDLTVLVEVFTLDGKRVFKRENGHGIFNLSHLPSGIYLLKQDQSLHKIFLP